MGRNTVRKSEYKQFVGLRRKAMINQPCVREGGRQLSGCCPNPSCAFFVVSSRNIFSRVANQARFGATRHRAGYPAIMADELKCACRPGRVQANSRCLKLRASSRIERKRIVARVKRARPTHRVGTPAAKETVFRPYP